MPTATEHRSRAARPAVARRTAARDQRDGRARKPASAVRNASPGAPSNDGRRQQRAVGLREGDAAPGESAEREPGAQRLAGDPGGGRPDRPERQPAGRRRDQRAGRRSQQRLRDRQRVPGQVADIDVGEAEQRQVERQPEDEPETEPGTPAAAVHRQPQQREADDRRPPPGGRGERLVQRKTAEYGADQPEHSAVEQGPAQPSGQAAVGRRLVAAQASERSGRHLWGEGGLRTQGR